MSNKLLVIVLPCVFLVCATVVVLALSGHEGLLRDASNVGGALLFLAIMVSPLIVLILKGD